ncbi:MAG: aldo/keto reductase [Planctomycetota bacterium]|nr:MAG: aldo/keto reductase [Planctomycetota bacterium]
MNASSRPLGAGGLSVGPLGLGCWPLAGMTREGITPEMATATVAAAIDAGISHLDTAYCYGASGESEKAIAAAIVGRRRDSVLLAGKCGIHWEPGRKQCLDGSPARIRLEVTESLRRLGTDHLDLLYLHAPDPQVPIGESAGELERLRAAGMTRLIGFSNVTLQQLRAAGSACQIDACQLPYNMLQREIENDMLPWCQKEGIAMIVYWPLMKGLLAGGMPRDRVFPTSDSRHKYPMFNGLEFQRNLDFVEVLRTEAARLACSIPNLVLAWTAEQPGVTSVLFGATSPEQVHTNATALVSRLDTEAREAIRAAIITRGPVAGRRAV